MRNNYRLLRIELKGKKEDTIMYEEIKKEIVRAKSRYYDWKVTKPEDGPYTKDYIAGRIFEIQCAINTLQGLLEKSVQK